ncbi:ATP-dependent nuclease [Stenotrophomonas riyadhensis]
MSLRKADIDIAWKHCRTDTRNLSVDTISFSSGHGSVDIRIGSRVTVLVGHNGSGKTRFLASLESELRSSGDLPVISAISGSYRGKKFWTTPSISKGSEKSGPWPPTEFIDPTLEAHKCLDLLAKQAANFEELLEQNDPIFYEDNVIQQFRHICGKNYESIHAWELEGLSVSTDTSVEREEFEDEDGAPTPYFKVKADGLEYDTTTMGFGELCSFYLIWRLLRQKANSTVFILDEPDSHLSPLSKIALFDVLAFYADKNKHHIVISSHSPDALYRASENEVLLIHRGMTSLGGLMISPASTKRSAMRELGLNAPCQVLILVEDVDALEAVRQTLSKLGPGLDRSFETTIAPGGASEILKLLERFPPDTRSVRVVAVLDGDKANKDCTDPRIFYLPGQQDPVVEALAAIGRSKAKFCKALGIDSARLARALSTVSYTNHHDFYSSLQSALGIATEVRDIRSAATAVWLSDTKVKKKFQKLCDNLHLELENMPLDFGHG